MCVLFLLFFSSQIFGQATGDYRSLTSGNWNTVGNWQRYNGTAWVTVTTASGFGYPGQNTATANVTIWNGNNMTLNVNPANSIVSLQIGSTTDATVGTLTFNNGRTLTVAGTVTIGNSSTTSSGNIVMTAGGILSVNSLVVSNATGSTFTPGTATGTVQFNATNTLPATVFTTFNRMTFSGGTTTAAVGLAINGIVTLNTGATFNDGGFTHTVGGNWVNNGGTFVSTGTIDFNSATANQTINGTGTTQNFNNVIVDKTGFTLTTGGSITTVSIAGTLAVNNGTFTIPAITFTVTGTTSVTGTLRISTPTSTDLFVGSITVNTGGTWNNSGNAPVEVQGGITNNGTFTSGTGVYTFDTNNQNISGTITIRSVAVTTITLTNNNALTVSTALSGSGSLIQTGTATLNLGGTSAITTLNALASGNTVNFTAASQTINAINYYNLTLSGSGTAIMQTGTNTISGNFTTSGTVRTTTADNLLVSGNLSVGDGTILTIGAFDFTVTGATTVGTGTSGRIAFSSATGTKTFVGLIRVNAGGSWINNTANSDITIEGGITNAGTFTSGTGIYSFTTNSPQDLNGTLSINNVTVTAITLNNNNTLTVSTALTGSGTLVQIGGSPAGASLNLGGTSTINALQATGSNNTVSYTGAVQTVFATNYYNLVLAGTNTKTLQAGTTLIGGDLTFSATSRATAVVGLTINGSLNLTGTNTARTFNAGSFLTHSIGKNFVNNNAFTAGTSTIIFNGTAPQTIGGSVATTFANLTINNSSGVSLDDGTNLVTKTVGTNLTLLAGYLTTTSSNLLILSQGATATVANAAIEAGGSVLVPQHNSPYINGPMRKIGTQAFVFPVGAVGTGCVPIGISAPAGATDAFDAQYFRGSANALGTISSTNLYNVSLCEYWTLNRTTGTPTVDVTGYWNENSPCNGEVPGGYVTDLTTLSLAHFNTTTTAWDNNSISANSSTVGATVSGGITWAAVSTFSPFALGNNNASKDNPLTIKLDYLTAVKSGGYNLLSWKAECSTFSNLFDIQRSYDGASFGTIDSVVAPAASDCSQPFSYKDYTASGNTVYYRIKMTDASGAVSYSDIVSISSTSNAIDFISIAPNPVKGDATLKISSSQNDNIELVLLSMDGKELQRSIMQVSVGANTVNLHTNSLAKGLYFVKGIFSGGQTHIIKFIKD